MILRSPIKPTISEWTEPTTIIACLHFYQQVDATGIQNQEPTLLRNSIYCCSHQHLQLTLSSEVLGSNPYIYTQGHKDKTSCITGL